MGDWCNSNTLALHARDSGAVPEFPTILYVDISEKPSYIIGQQAGRQVKGPPAAFPNPGGRIKLTAWAWEADLNGNVHP